MDSETISDGGRLRPGHLAGDARRTALDRAREEAGGTGSTRWPARSGPRRSRRRSRRWPGRPCRRWARSSSRRTRPSGPSSGPGSSTPGLYHRQAMHVFLGVKLFLLGLATVVGIGLTTTKVLPMGKALPISLVLFFAGMIGPSFWLDKRKKARQTTLRRGLPDALDVLDHLPGRRPEPPGRPQAGGRRTAIGTPGPGALS